MENYYPGNTEPFRIDEQAKATFREMANWTKFLAIMGFIGLGFLVVAGFFVAMFFSMRSGSRIFGGFGAIGICFMYLLMAAVFFYPVFALLNYSNGIKKAFAINDQRLFNSSLAYLKNMFKYIAILHIIFMGIYAIMIVFMIIARL